MLREYVAYVEGRSRAASGRTASALPRLDSRRSADSKSRPVGTMLAFDEPRVPVRRLLERMRKHLPDISLDHGLL